MSRHNRRRVRLPRYISQQESLETRSCISHPYPDEASDKLLTARRSTPRRNDLTARHWHNRILAWQFREKRQRGEKHRLEAEKQRLFGGDSHDGVDADFLCGQMMEYFVGLDYLEG